MTLLSFRALSLTLSLCFLLSPAVLAEDTGSASRNEAFKNPTNEGTPQLKSIVWYPTKGDSKDLATAPEDGFSVLVFLHGRGGPAMVYTPLAKAFTKLGYVVVLSDTALRDAKKQVQDGKALFKALEIANNEDGSFWKEALNMKRVGLSGHSMGGGSTAHILAANPGYAAGFCFAPWQGFQSFAGNAKSIKAPIGIVHGKGDKVLNWKATGKRLYDSLSADCDRFLYLMDETVNHYNIALNIPFRSKDGDKSIYQSTEKLCVAFFEKHLNNKGEVLATLLKKDNGDKKLVKLYRGAQSAAAPAPKATQAKPARKGKARLY
jgi:dienelactone hydrolase